MGTCMRIFSVALFEVVGELKPPGLLSLELWTSKTRWSHTMAPEVID